MKSRNVKQEATEMKPDLVTRSYSPTLRVLVVGAIFIIAVFLLAACGSKSKTASPSASTPTQSAVSTPTSTVQAGLTCKADTSSDSINPGKYFGDILAQARKDWRADAVISSVRFDAQGAKNFDRLCTLRTDSNWKVILYSLSSKTEEVLDLDGTVKDSQGLPHMVYEVVLKNPPSNSQTYMSLTISDMKQQGKWKFYEYSRPETYASESKYAANLFLNWKMTMSQVVQKMIDRVKDEKITGAGFYIYAGKASLKTHTSYVDIYWVNGANKTQFYVEPISLTTYEVKF